MSVASLRYKLLMLQLFVFLSCLEFASLWYITGILPGSSLFLRFNSHFPGGPGLAGTRMSAFWILLELRIM